MTVSYTLQVATCTGVGCFWRLLFRWRGSTWKLLWPNLLAFVILVIGISLLHRTVLNDDQKGKFQKMARSCKRDKDMIPMAFILGFYVNLVITRWWDQYVKMPWPDGMALYISTLIYGQDDRGRLIRRTLIRYCNLALVLTLRLFSTRIMRRFPTYDHLVDAGFLLVNEKRIFEHMDQKTPHPKYWMPLVWAGGIMVNARKEGRVRDDFSLKTLVDALNTFRGECGGMIDYDWICIPLVYTQVVTLAVYTFIVTAVVGSQATRPNQEFFDIYVPVFSFMQLFFYMGWLKVAESLVNPWGDDDDDFEVNWMVDRHLQVSYIIVDEMHQDHPEMLRDQYWDEIFPSELPYTQASRQFNCRPKSSYNFGLDDLMSQQRGMNSNRYYPQTDIEEEGDSDSVVYRSGSGSISREESHPVKIVSKAQKLAKDREKRSKHAHIDKRFKSKAATTGTRMLYEADTSSLSSLTALFPSDPKRRLTEDENMFSMSDLSISSEKEIAVYKDSEDLDNRNSLQEPHRSPFKRELLTDLRPVDLSAPDSYNDYYPYFGSDEWWRHSSTEVEAFDPTESAQSVTNQRTTPSTRVKVVVPTGEPVTHTFGRYTPDTASAMSQHSEKGSTHSILASDMNEQRPSLIDRHVKFSFASDTMNGAHEDMFTRVLLPTRLGSTDSLETPTSLAGSTPSTTSLVTTTPLAGTATTSSTGRGSVLSSRVIDMLDGAAETGPLSVRTAPAQQQQPQQQQGGEEVAITIDELVNEMAADRVSTPYVPSHAIPVPAVSQAHAMSPVEPPGEEERDMMEAAMAARRGFHELEPITEQTEASAQKERDEAKNPPGDEDGPSSSS